MNKSRERLLLNTGLRITFIGHIFSKAFKHFKILLNNIITHIIQVLFQTQAFQPAHL